MAPDTRGEYEYERLEASSFRIIKLQPGSNKDGLQCELMTRGINQSKSSAEHLKYFAISYRWGTARKFVSCEGANLKVPQNLHDCLTRLRSEKNAKNLWADSICIDQADKEEKPRQLRIMGDIYRNAEKVYVWLGEKREEKAFALIESLKDLDDSEFTKAVKRCEKDQWKSLRKVLELDWFERVWTLQETGLASNGVVVCGPNRIGWKDFAKVCGRLHDRYKKERLDHHLPLYRVTRTNIDFLNGPQGPADVFKTVCWRKCSEEKDRIYGVLGHVAFKRFRETHNNTPFVEIIPKQPAHKLFKAVAKQLLQLQEPLYTLSLVQPKHNPKYSTEYPSWVPLFNNASISVLADEKRGPHTWSAGGEAEPVRPPSKNKVLRLKGVRLGSIKWHSETIRNGIKDEDKHDVIKSFWQQIRAHYGNKFSEKNGIWEFCRIIFFEDHFLKRDGLQKPVTKEQMAHCVDYFVKNGIHLSEKERLQKDFPNGHADELFLDAIHHCRSRRFIVTETGRLGLATNVSSTGRNGQKADEVWVLTGSQVPFLLRPQKEEGKYLLCGECFIRAMMNGRAIDPLKNGGLLEKSVELV